jgi:hypothetical protein
MEQIHQRRKVKNKKKITKRPDGVELCKICEKEPRYGKTSSYCIDCNTKYMIKYRATHPEYMERQAAHARAYWPKNKEKINAAARKRHKEKTIKAKEDDIRTIVERIRLS